MKETDEDEAVQAAENWGQSVAAAGSYLHKGKMKIWARSDMDGVVTWNIGKGEEEELEVSPDNGWSGHSDKLIKSWVIVARSGGMAE